MDYLSHRLRGGAAPADAVARRGRLARAEASRVVYAGHAAIALALKAQEPRLPIVPLTIACYGPDWLQWLLALVFEQPGMSPHTHSISAIIVSAFAAAGLYALVVRRPGVRWIFIGWLSHWPADFITGRKPLTGLDDIVGLHLYARPWADFAVESAVVVVGCVIYGRAFGRGDNRYWVVVALGAALIAMQGVMDMSIAITK